MKEDPIKERALFALGLLGVSLALIPFKESFRHIVFFYTQEGRPITVLGVWGIFTGLASISVYFYALAFLKYSYSDKIQSGKVFRSISWLGNFFYAAALFYPLLTLVGTIGNTLPIAPFLRKYTYGFLAFDMLIGLPYIYFVWKQSKKISKKDLETTSFI